MIETPTLLIFATAVLALMLSPGPNMAFVMTHGVTHGFMGGAAAGLGIGLADLILTVLTASGVAAAVTAWPPSFDLIRYGGVAYFLRLAYKTVPRAGTRHQPEPSRATLREVFLRAMLNSLLNPKALLFFLVFLPQFVVPGGAPMWQQLLVLGCVLTMLSTLFHTLLGAVAGSTRGFLGRHARAVKWHSLGLAFLLVVLAIRLAVMSRGTL
ncbi:MAG: LysE family translocator [Proteobacteria bacterium]|nr:LysE family translocator [Pseudomonadota bacterium]